MQRQFAQFLVTTEVQIYLFLNGGGIKLAGSRYDPIFYSCSDPYRDAEFHQYIWSSIGGESQASYQGESLDLF